MEIHRGALSVLLALAAIPAHAQYFGKNPVQWERLRFEVLQTEHFDIHYYAEEKAAAEQVGRMAERCYARLSATLGFQLKTRQPVVLYASQGHFQQTNTSAASRAKARAVSPRRTSAAP